jgi:hypothetical protein
MSYFKLLLCHCKLNWRSDITLSPYDSIGILSRATARYSGIALSRQQRGYEEEKRTPYRGMPSLYKT